MSLSEACILASQESLPNKRVCCDSSTIEKFGSFNCNSDDARIIMKKPDVHVEECILDGDKKPKSLPNNNKQDVRQDDTLSDHCFFITFIG